jgi:hypothetical protein
MFRSDRNYENNEQQLWRSKSELVTAQLQDFKDRVGSWGETYHPVLRDPEFHLKLLDTTGGHRRVCDEWLALSSNCIDPSHFHFSFLNNNFNTTPIQTCSS